MPINDTVTQLISLTKPSVSVPIQPNLLKSTIYPIDPIETSRNVGSHNPELSNCERTTHRSTNCEEYQLPQTHIIQNVIVANQSDNSDIQITLPAPETNIHHSSKEVMRTSIPKIK